MKIGKVSESILKRSVLKQLHAKNREVQIAAGVGKDYSEINTSDSESIVLSTNSMTWEVGCGKTFAAMAVYQTLNNVVISGSDPIGIVVDVLLPTISNEASLRELMKELDEVCQREGIQILGGHTQVTRAVRRMVITVTGVGKNCLSRGESVKERASGKDIVVTKWIGLSGTALLAQEKEEEIRTRYAQPFIDGAKGYMKYASVREEAAIARGLGVVVMHDLSEGGIFGGLWEMAEALKVGLEIDLKKIPIRQETVEISEFFAINPYKLLSNGSLLLVTDNGENVVRELEKKGISSVVIGKTTDQNDRVLLQGEDRRFLETAQTDELYKILTGE